MDAVNVQASPRELRTPNLREREAVWGRGWYRSKEC